MKHISQIIQSVSSPVACDSAERHANNSSSVESDLENSSAELREEGSRVVGVPTGFSDIDHLTSGLQPSDLIVVASRSSMGKTSLALGIAYGAAVNYGKAVAFFTLETNSEQLISRLVAMETGVEALRLRLGQINDNEWDRISLAFRRLSGAPIFVDDSATNIMDILSKARRLNAELGLDLIIVDPIQLLADTEESDRSEILSEASKALKGLARELDVPIVVLSQISWDVDSRSDHRPTLADLRESGSLCNDGDLIMFIYRADKYEEDSENRGVAEIIIAKHRSGPVGSINLRFLDRTSRFANLESYPA